MKPKSTTSDQFELFQANFDQILYLDHELCQLAKAINWKRFNAELANCYSKRHPDKK